jgi:IclR helix-turn-helix domain
MGRHDRAGVPVSGSGLSIELTDGQLREVMHGALARKDKAGLLAELHLSFPALSSSAGRALLVEQADGVLSAGLVRGLVVLSAFVEGGPPRRVGEVAAELQMTPSNVATYIRTLKAL